MNTPVSIINLTLNLKQTVVSFLKLVPSVSVKRKIDHTDDLIQFLIV